MKKKNTDFGIAISNFLITYLSGMRGLSEHTVHSYRDTFKLLLIYARDCKNIHPDNFKLSDFKRELILEYLEWLKNKRNLCQRSVNQRLAALHSFCRYLHSENPEYISEYKKILSIPFIKCHNPVIDYLTSEALDAILKSVDTSTNMGKRDFVILSTLYDTGARVQELCRMNVNDVRLSSKPYVILHGKGNKSRSVPLMTNTASLLKTHIEFESNKIPMYGSQPLFATRQNTRFTRSSIAHIVAKYADIARKTSDLIPEKVTPHTFRHTKAVHLCQAGVEMIYIRDILGHSKLSTTEIYAKVSLENIRDALEKAYPELNPHVTKDWSNDESLMAYLDSL